MVNPTRSKSMVETSASAASISSTMKTSHGGSKRKLALRKGKKATKEQHDENQKSLQPPERTSRFMAPTKSSSFKKKKSPLDRSGHGKGNGNTSTQKPSSTSSLLSSSASARAAARASERAANKFSIRAMAKSSGRSPAEMLKDAQSWTSSSSLVSSASTIRSSATAPTVQSLSSSTTTSPSSSRSNFLTAGVRTTRQQRPERQRHFNIDQLDTVISSTPTKSKSVAGSTATIDESTRKKLKESWLKTINSKKDKTDDSASPVPKSASVFAAASPTASPKTITSKSTIKKKKKPTTGTASTAMKTPAKTPQRKSPKSSGGKAVEDSPSSVASPHKKKIRVRPSSQSNGLSSPPLSSPSSSPKSTKSTKKAQAVPSKTVKNDREIVSRAVKASAKRALSPEKHISDATRALSPEKRLSDATAATESSDSGDDGDDMEIEELVPSKPSSLSKIWGTLAEAKQRQADLRSKRNLLSPSSSFCTSSITKSDRQNAAEAYRKVLVKKKKDEESVSRSGSGSRSSSSALSSGPPPRPTPSSPTKPSSFTSQWTKKGSSWSSPTPVSSTSSPSSSTSRKETHPKSLAKHLANSSSLDVMDDDIDSTGSSSSSINSNAPAAPAEANDIINDDDDSSLSQEDFSWMKKSQRVILSSTDTSLTEDLSDSTTELEVDKKKKTTAASSDRKKKKVVTPKKIEKAPRRGKRPENQTKKIFDATVDDDDDASQASCVSELSITDLSKPSSILKKKDGKSLFGSRRSLNGSLNLSARFSMAKLEVIEVPRLYDDDDIQHLFYDDDELANMRHEAFCENVGLNAADFD
mmetsp:Transcript_14890/g.36493  ORF Transcript_14890/g.36493 Transcript_14890/m.36493 type:complete len:812 (-) Transcript_14890:158-2593(-)